MEPNTPPVTQPGFGRAQRLMAQSGRARGLLLSTAEATVGVARGTTFTSLEPQKRPGPSSDSMAQHKTGVNHTFALTLSQDIFDNAFDCLQVRMPAHGEASALVSMFRGIGIDYSTTPLGRGRLSVG